MVSAAVSLSWLGWFVPGGSGLQNRQQGLVCGAEKLSQTQAVSPNGRCWAVSCAWNVAVLQWPLAVNDSSFKLFVKFSGFNFF